MKLDGTADFTFSAAEVWTSLHDIEVLTRTIPGCQSMLSEGDQRYRVAVSLGVAAIKGDYEGVIEVNDVEFPHHYTLRGEGEGKPGYVKVDVICKLEPTEAGCTLTWSSEAEVGGLIAGIGGRVLTGISKHMAKQFFKALTEDMNAVLNPEIADTAAEETT
ncbi:MAG: SRPBCC family protein [Gammaproteobacteria bacterium]